MRKFIHTTRILSIIALSFSALLIQAQTSVFNYTGAIQNYTVPAGVTSISIEAKGAQGGTSSVATGGRGASMKGNFAVTPGQVIRILVGQQAPVISAVSRGGGGGGGTFVVDQATNQPMVVAGGGGGAAGQCCGVIHNGVDAVVSINGTAGLNQSGGTGAGGVNGNGGGAATQGQNSGAGGGFLTDGANGVGATGGKSYLNGGAGGLNNSSNNGGFGGGGGSHVGAGGGGGGYSGGGATGGGGQWGGGGGGGSINTGTSQVNSAGVNTGNGSVTITVLATPAGALNFVKSSNTYIQVPHSTSLNLGAEFTIESWVNYTGINSTIIDKGNYNYLLQVNCNNPGFAPNRLNFYNRNTGWVNSTGTVPEGVWTHVAVTLKNGTMTFYINGVASGTAAVTFAQDSGPVNIGRQSPSSCACNIFNGSIDELRVWNRALSSCEINANKSCELNGAQTGLAAYYKFNQGIVNTNNSGVNTLTDASGNNNTGTLTNFALTGSTSNWVAAQVSGTCSPYVAPNAAILGNLSACPGGTSQLSNSISGGTWSSSNTAVASISASGLVTAVASGTTVITYTNSCGGVATANFTVNALPAANISASGSTTFCNGGSVTLTASAGTSYLWSNGATTPSITVNTAGAYTVTVTSASGCSQTSAATNVVVNATSVANITASGATTFCAGGSVTLTATGGASYLWSNGSTDASITVSAGGTYSVTATSADGCVSAPVSTTVTVNPVPTAVISASGPTTFCAGGSVTLSALQNLPGHSLSFNGTNNSVRIPDVNYAGVNSFTIEAWIKPNNITTNPYYEIARQQGSPNWIFSFQNFGAILSFGLNTTTGYTELDAPITASDFTDGNWHHVAATYDGANCRVYKDGVLIGTSSKTGNIVFSSGSGLTTYIGAYSGGEYFNGLIDEVRFWNTARTQSQLDADKLTSLPGNTTGLTAYYKFDEGTGTTTNDASGNGHHGTLVNGTGWSSQTPISSSSGGTYLWSNGATTPSITVNTAGAYTVTVTSASGCSQTSAATNVVVNATPVANITASGSTTFCAGGSVTLTATGGASYLWSNGSTDASITVSAGGTYSVTATSADGCVSAPASITLTELPAPTVNAITNREVCHNAVPVTAVAFTGNISGTVYNWTNNNPSIGLAASGTGDIASFVGQNAGTVPVYATITVTPSYTSDGNTCTGTPVSFTIRVNPIPVIDPIANITVCNGTVTQPFNISSGVAGSVFKWTQPTNIPNVHVGLPNGEGATVPSFTAINTGTTPITATFYAVSYYSGETMGCGTSRLFDVTVNPTPEANITASGSTTFCAGGSVILTATGGASYLWSNGSTDASITVTSGGTYSVVATSAEGCASSSVSTTVTVNPVPVAAISTSGPTTFCAGGSVTLTATGGTSYLWSNGSTDTSITASAGGTYSVVATSAEGCTSSSVSTTVTVNPVPTAAISASGSTTFCAGSSVTLTATSGASYLWSNGSTDASITVSAGGTYSVTATSADGCVSAPASITLTKLPAPTVNAITNREVCHNAVPVTAVAFTGNISGTVYNWTNNNPSIGLAASGTGDIASFVGQNAGTVPVYATITVTPSYTSDGNTCTGTPVSFTIRVNPIPVIDPIANITVCNGTVTQPFNISSGVAGSVFKWTQPTNIPNVHVGLPNGEGATVPSFTAINTGTTPITATFYAVSYYSGETMGCGTSRQFDVTVNPTPEANITASGSTTFCAGGAVTLTASTGASYLWSNGAQTQSVTVNQSGNYSVVVTSAAGCTNTSSPVTVTVNALPAIPVISTSGSTTVCVGSPVTLSAGGANAGKAIEFDGSNDNIVIPNNAAFNFTSQYTVESWINLRNYQYGTIIAKFEDDNNNRGWMVNIGETGAPTVHVVHSRLGTWTNPIQWNSGFQPVLNTWYHIAVVFDASLSSNQIKLYVNGALTAQTSWPYTITPNAANMYIGGYDNPGNGVNGGANGRFFNGRLDEVRVWNVARTAAQISANYNQVMAAPVSGLVAAYSFSENTGNAIQDLTGVHNGTMVNNPTRISNGPLTSGGGNNTYLWSTGATSSSITVNQVGNYSVTVTNENGCAATSAPVAVSNYAMPTITCPGNITVNSPANQCGASVTYPNAVVTAGPANPTVTYSHPSGSFFPVGNTTVTATVTDACGNTASCTFVVTVQDITPPVLGCTNQASSAPVNFMRGTSVGGTAAIVSWTGLNGASQYSSPSLGSSCSESWRPFGTLCDETPNTNSMTISTKSNPNSGITFNSGSASGIGVFVVDLGATQTFNLAQVYQMFSDGKTTHVRGFYHPSVSATAPSITDAGWVEMFPETLVGAGAISGNNVTLPTDITFNATSARYVRFYVRNDGRYGSSTWIETRSIKLFSTAPAVNNVVVTAADGECNAVATYNVQALDNCSGTVVTYSIPSGSSFPIGTTPVQVTATDASGNVATCSFSVIVNAPEINVTGNSNNIPAGTTTTAAAANTNFGGTLPNTPVSKTFVIQNTGTAALKIGSIGLSGTDASAFAVTGITLPATIAPNASASFNLVFNSNTPGIKNATVTINNNDCNEIAYQFAVTAEITCTNPVFVNMNPQVQATTTAVTCNAVVNYPLSVNGIPAPALSYCFSGATTGTGSGTGTGNTFNKGNTHVIVTAVNPCSTVLYEFDVIVVDNILPIATSQNITVQLGANGTASITAAQVNNGSTDNCGIATIALDKTSFDCSNVGANTVTLTVTDVNGNSSTATATVTVVDNILPIATSQNITVQLGANGTASITAAQVNNGSSDNCGIASIALDKTSFDCSNVGANSVTLTVTDVNGNSSTATAVVTVVDNILPIATSQNITVQLGANGTASITAAQVNNGSSDNCGIASIALDKTSFDCSNVGANTVTLTVTDVNGNASTATAVVTVVDNILPIATSQNITVQLGANGTASITAAQVNNGSTDNCGIASIALDKTSFDCSNVGANTVTLTVTDVNGNSSTATAVVTVVDNINPTITAPANIAQGTDAGVCGATVNLGTPVTADNCSVATVTNNAPALFPVGTTVVTWTVTDVNGNSSTTTQTVVITDTEKPRITAPAMISVVNTPGTCATTVDLGTPVTSDNCGVATVTNNAPALFPVGTTVVTWTVTDIHGNVTDTATQTVVVIDNELPTISVSNISVNNDAGKCGATVVISQPVTADNCGVASVMGVRNDNKLLTEDYPVGTTTITWTVRDINGNMKTITQTIVVTDNEKPVIVCAANQVFCANTGGNTQYSIPVLNQSDNCGIASTTYTVTGATNRTGTGTNASGSFAIGTSTVTFTVTDIHGNVSTCSFTVRINPLPVASITAASPNALCNQFILTANSTQSGPYSYQWLYNNNTKATTQQLSLGLTDADGVYSVYTTDANGCRSEQPATYNYQKQNLISSYTIIGIKEVELGQYDKVESGSVGVMSSRGEAEFDKYSSVTGAGSFVKAPRIETDRGVTINSKIYGTVNVSLPTMQYNLSNTRYLQDKTVNSNVTATVAGNYDEVTLKKGSNVTLTGTIFGKIKLEEGASVRFTSTTIDVAELQIEKGPKSGGYSYIRFAPNTSIRVSKKVTIGSDVIVNPEAYQVTFYMADNRRDEEKFHVKGDDTRITANIILPDGKLKVTGGNYGDDRCDHRPHSYKDCRHRGHGHHDCDHRGHGDRDCRDDVFMTGLFIAEEVESEGKNVIWNSYNCAAPSAPVTAVTSNNNQASVTEEEASSFKLQASSKSEEELKVTVMPNPSTTYFTLKLESRYDAPVTLRVVDGSGRVVDSRAKIGSNSTIQIGHNYQTGNYFAELVQGTRRKVIQLIKVR